MNSICRRLVLIRSTVLLCVWLCSGSGESLNAQTLDQEQVEVAMAVQMLSFVSWPTGEGARGDLLVGVYANSEIVEVFEELLADSSTPGQKQVVLLSSNATREEIESLDVIYFDGSRESEIGLFITRLGDTQALLMGSFDGFLEMGGMVNFVKKQKKVSFDIDLRNSKRKGIEFRAQLLRIANRVIGE